MILNIIFNPQCLNKAAMTLTRKFPQELRSKTGKDWLCVWKFTLILRGINIIH